MTANKRHDKAKRRAKRKQKQTVRAAPSSASRNASSVDRQPADLGALVDELLEAGALGLGAAADDFAEDPFGYAEKVLEELSFPWSSARQPSSTPPSDSASGAAGTTFIRRMATLWDWVRRGPQRQRALESSGHIPEDEVYEGAALLGCADEVSPDWALKFRVPLMRTAGTLPTIWNELIAIGALHITDDAHIEARAEAELADLFDAVIERGAITTRMQAAADKVLAGFMAEGVSSRARRVYDREGEVRPDALMATSAIIDGVVLALVRHGRIAFEPETVYACYDDEIIQPLDVAAWVIDDWVHHEIVDCDFESGEIAIGPGTLSAFQRLSSRDF